MRKIALSRMVHEQVLEANITFALMYTVDHILPVLPVKDMINQNGKKTMPLKLATGKNFPISNLHVLFCPYFYTKLLHMLGRRR